MFRNAFIFVLFFKLFFGSNSTKCPEKQVVFPCICTQTNGSLPDISCSRNDFNMSEVIENIRLSDPTGVEQRFGKLFWTNGKQINITNNFFSGVSFQHLYIGTRRQLANISHISSGAFSSVSHRVKSIVIRSKYLSDEHNLFDALRRLTVVESIGIEGSGLRTVPKHAFKTPEDCQPMTNCVQNRLKSIKFRIGFSSSLIFLQEIQSYAFYDLPNLRSIDLNSHDITRIHKNAFTFGHKSDQILKIDLSKQWNKQLTPDSFDVKAFEGINRPVLLDLYANRYLTTIPETVFRPLLESDSRNRIRLGMKMDCNCSLYWLWRDRQQFRKQFIEWTYDDLPETDHKFSIQCSDKVEHFWDRNESDFSECEPISGNIEL